MSNPTIPIIFENKTGEPAYVQFLNGHFGPSQFGAGGTVLLAGDTSYSLKQLASAVPALPHLGKVPNVALNDFTNGRIYINLGSSGLHNLGRGYQPAPNNMHDPNYKLKYGFIELNVYGTASNNLDLSYIDYFSFSLSSSTWKNSKEVNRLESPDSSQLIKAINRVTSAGSFVPHQIPNPPFQKFVRVLGPGLSSDYHDWTNYFNHLEKYPHHTQIQGHYAGLSHPVTKKVTGQNYNFQASFDSSSATVTLTGGANLVGHTKITIKYSDLNAVTGVYGANPPYTVHNTHFGVYSTTGIVDDVFGWVVGDLLAGLNMGFPGSKKLIPNSKLTFGQATSTEWFTAAAADRSLQFSGAQSNPEYYNGYAGALQPLTDAYGFPFSDRLPKILLYFSPPTYPHGVDYLKITMEPF